MNDARESKPGAKQSAAHGFIPSTLHVLTLSSLAVAQPLYDLLGRQAEFFVAHQTSSGDLWAFVAILSLLLPGLAAVPALIFAPLRRLLLPLMLGGPAVLLALLIAQKIHPFGIAVSALLSLAGAAAFVLAYYKIQAVRLFLSFLSPAILVLPGLFLFNSAATEIISPKQTEAAPAPASAAPAIERESRTPVIFLVLDELPLVSLLDEELAIDRGRYPGFARLADMSTWYRHANSIAAVTNYAVPAILSGLYPNRGVLPIAEGYPQNLFTLLAPTHDVRAHESVTLICPEHICPRTEKRRAFRVRMRELLRDSTIVYLHIVLPETLRGKLPSIAHNWKGFGAKSAKQSKAKAKYSKKEQAILKAIRTNIKGDRIALFDDFIGHIEPYREGRPPLHFLHVLFPHTPWAYYPSGLMYTEEKPDKIPGLDAKQHFWLDDEVTMLRSYQRHLLQIGALDKKIGELLDHLQAIDMLDESLIVVTSDHGALFRNGDGYRKPTATNFQAITPIPLMIKYPRQASGRIDDRPVEIVDIFPSVAKALGIPLSKPVDGKAFSELDAQGKASLRFYEFFERWNKNWREVDPADIGLREQVKTKIDLFGQHDQAGLFRAGPYAVLIGQETTAFDVKQSGVNVRIDQAELLTRVDKSSGILPGMLRGRLDNLDEGAAAPDLAIAVNGVIHATTRATPAPPEGMLFEALIPETAFQEGDNTVTVYRVEQGESAPRLYALSSPDQLRASRVTLPATQQQVVHAGDKGVIPLVAGSVTGYVDVVNEGKNSVELIGWAVDVANNKAAQTLLVLVDDDVVFSARHTRMPRKDIAASRGIPDAGYRIEVPRAALKLDSDPVISVIAVTDYASATELNYHAWYRWKKRSAVGAFFHDLFSGERPVPDFSYSLPAQAQALKRGERRFPLSKGVNAGWVETVERGASVNTFSGWAGNTETGLLPSEIAIMNHGVYLGTAITTHWRKDVADTFGKTGLLRSGFKFQLPNDTDHQGGLRFFAVFPDGTASEIPCGEKCP